MYGMSLLEVSGNGMASGIFGFIVADVGMGGSPRSDGVRPGISRVTTFFIDREFCGTFSDSNKYARSKARHSHMLVQRIRQC